MGKKKSKVAKVKQAKAKHNNGKNKKNIPSSLGGISLSKGANSKFQQQMASGKALVTIMENNNKGTIQPSPFNKKFNKTKGKMVFLSSTPPPSNDVAAVTKAIGYDEKADFDRQMASLQQRQAASRNAITKQKKSTLLKEGGVVSSLIQSFQPASFQVEKTTTDMFHETLDQMQSMSGVGQPRPSAESLPTPVRSNQSWVAVKVANVSLDDKNPFAALQEQEEDSDKEHPQNPIIQMAPPSFTLLPRITPTPATTPLREPQHIPDSGIQFDTEDIDPDL